MTSSLVAAPLARDVIVVEGPDAATYLQGQLSQDVAALRVDTTSWSLLLQPQGKMEAWLRVSREADERFLLDVDAGAGEATMARLRRFLLRTKAEITLIDAGSSHGWALLAPEGSDDADLDAWEPPEEVFLDAPFALRGLRRRDLMADEAFDPPGDAVVVSADRLEVARIGAAVPAMGSEITTDTIPAELGAWLIDASVSFTKGCYTGQELVARIDSRGGNVPRHLRVVDLTSGSVPTGAELAVAGEPVGVVTSVAATDAGGVGLAFVKRSVDGGEVGALAGGEPATIRPG